MLQIFGRLRRRHPNDRSLTLTALACIVVALPAAERSRAEPPCEPPEPPLCPWIEPPTEPWPEGVPQGKGPGAATEPPLAPKGQGEGLTTPVVSMHVRVLANSVVGKDLEYHIDVDNRSSAPAHHVLVRNPLPANARFVRADPQPSAKAPELLWRLETLQPGAHKEIVLVLSPTGAGDVENCARVQFEHGECVRTRIARPIVSVRKSGPSQALVNEPLNFQLTVSNDGDAAAAQVKLSDTLASGLQHSSGKGVLTWEIGTLEPGQRRVFDYSVVAKASGKLCNQAVATAKGGLQARAESCVSVTEAKMSLSMHGPARRYVNLPASYQITLTNSGTAPLSNVQLVDPLPERTMFVSASGGGKLTGNQVAWSVGALEPGATRTFELVLRAEAEGRICNRVTATADRGVTAQAEACTEFKGVSALMTELIDTDDPVEVGTDTSYVITVVNQGSKPATNLTIVAEIPAQQAVVRASGFSGNRKEGSKLIFEPATLQPKAVARYTIQVKALQPGDIRFKVDVSADQLTSGPVHEEESTTLYNDLPAGRSPVEGSPRSRRSARR